MAPEVAPKRLVTISIYYKNEKQCRGMAQCYQASVRKRSKRVNHHKACLAQNMIGYRRNYNALIEN